MAVSSVAISWSYWMQVPSPPQVLVYAGVHTQHNVESHTPQYMYDGLQNRHDINILHFCVCPSWLTLHRISLKGQAERHWHFNPTLYNVINFVWWCYFRMVFTKCRCNFSITVAIATYNHSVALCAMYLCYVFMSLLIHIQVSPMSFWTEWPIILSYLLYKKYNCWYKMLLLISTKRYWHHLYCQHFYIKNRTVE